MLISRQLEHSLTDAKRICVVITARPSYARIKTALNAMQASKAIDLKIITTGSLLLNRYGAAVNIIERDGFEVSSRLHTVFEGENLITAPKSTAIQLLELTTELERIKPDAVVTIADRYETISTAIAASYMNIPLIHIQGGEVTGSIDEKVRHAVTKLADFHLVSTEEAKERVVKMGEDHDSVIVTGCPSIDLAKQALSGHCDLDEIMKQYTSVGEKFSTAEDYLVVMQHPVTTQYSDSLEQIMATLNAVYRTGKNVFCFWPNPDSGSDAISNGIRRFREQYELSNFAFFKNIQPNHFLQLLINSSCLVGNSSVGIRECSFLGVPVVNIGQRQQFRQRGSNVEDVVHDAEKILLAIHKQMLMGKHKQSFVYGDGNSGEKIAKAIASWRPCLKQAIRY